MAWAVQYMDINIVSILPTLTLLQGCVMIFSNGGIIESVEIFAFSHHVGGIDGT